MIVSMPSPSPALRAAWQRHERRWAGHLYVYAVVSRRSRGVSVGINLNPGKECNFDCAYCQVDRQIPGPTRRVDLDTLAAELNAILEAARDGSLYEAPRFDALPPGDRAVRDIAFSGDGEPTTFPRFREAVEVAAEARRRFALDATKLVLITDAAYLAKPAVREAIAVLDANNGEIWAKLDAGTEEYFRRVNRPNVTLQHVLDNILDAARLRPVVIQSLWMRMDGAPPPEAEVAAYCDRVDELLANGARLKALQLYTIARKPAEPSVSPLTDDEMDLLAGVVRARVPVPVEVYYGVAQAPAVASATAARACAPARRRSRRRAARTAPRSRRSSS
ncbi:MAG: Radical domain protein [Acidobacteria bacterium]|nr:Radical domain protein [Acidobacteriota bacterium]